MRKASILAVLITLTLWLGGCTGSMSVNWGPDGYEYEIENRPSVYREAK